MVSAAPTIERGGSSDSSAFFEQSSEPPHGGSTEFSLYLWERVKGGAIRPQWGGPESDDPELRLEFLRGARSMGYELVDLDDPAELARLKAMRPIRYPLQPQQLVIVDHLNAAGLDEYVVEIPRRASKTTTIFCWLHGRCLSRPDYFVTFSAQSGVKGSARLREWANQLDRVQPADDADLPPWLRGTRPKRPPQALALFGEDQLTAPPPAGRGFRIMRGEVGKGIYYDNGSKVLVLKPDAESYRGEAGDVSWIDEAQEIDPEEGADLLAGIIPLQDTREDAALVISGTAGEARIGPFWERVNKLRSRDPDIGGVDYAAHEDTPWEVIEDEDQAMELLARIHPGIGTLTTLEKMRKNWRKLPKPQWAREYLSMWPETFGQTAIAADQWQRGALQAKPKRPARVAFGLAIKPGGSVAAICAAWRTPLGLAYVEVVDHRQGTQWLPARMQELTRTYRGSTIAYDKIGEAEQTATEAAVLKPRPAMRVQTYNENAAGCIQVLRDLERGTLRHADQVGLNAAVEIAAKREVRGSDRGVWLWTPAEKGGDITCLDAATRALRNWDQHYAGRTGTYRPSMGDD
ncbi:MAG: hypothetical protein D3X82_01315 [Candidatus Leucobacter sulfamidivorax]|nr:hypothetical protein [Candidatus Leucobacter sulfamidivorax]